MADFFDLSLAFVDLADVQRPGAPVQDEVLSQPCDTEFTTTAEAEVKATTKEALEKFFGGLVDKVKIQAGFICRSNKECPEPRFQRFVDFKVSSVGKKRVATLVVAWKCKK